MATERRRSPFSRDVSGRWTANATTAGEERCGESTAGQGAQRTDDRSKAFRQNR